MKTLLMFCFVFLILGCNDPLKNWKSLAQPSSEPPNWPTAQLTFDIQEINFPDAPVGSHGIRGVRIFNLGSVRATGLTSMPANYPFHIEVGVAEAHNEDDLCSETLEPMDSCVFYVSYYNIPSGDSSETLEVSFHDGVKRVTRTFATRVMGLGTNSPGRVILNGENIYTFVAFEGETFPFPVGTVRFGWVDIRNTGQEPAFNVTAAPSAGVTTPITMLDPVNSSHCQQGMTLNPGQACSFRIKFTVLDPFLNIDAVRVTYSDGVEDDLFVFKTFQAQGQ